MRDDLTETLLGQLNAALVSVDELVKLTVYPEMKHLNMVRWHVLSASERVSKYVAGELA